MAVGVETNLLAGDVFVVNVRTVAQRFAVQGAQIIEIAALVAFAVIGFGEYRTANFCQRRRARLGGGHLQR